MIDGSEVVYQDEVSLAFQKAMVGVGVALSDQVLRVIS